MALQTTLSLRTKGLLILCRYSPGEHVEHSTSTEQRQSAAYMKLGEYV